MDRGDPHEEFDLGEMLTIAIEAAAKIHLDPGHCTY